MTTRYVIYGAGAIGAAVGAHLWRTGHSALLVGRAAHVNRIREAGLSLVTPDETFVLHVPATIDLRETGVLPGDVILLCVKSQDTETALREVRDAGADPKSVPIFCLQNGITNEDRALRLFENVHGVMLNVPGVFLEPGVVSNPIRGNAGFMDIGRYPVGTDDVTQRTVSDLIKAGYAVNEHHRVMEAK
ncbi:MAG: ketopantoate reductase family protein, partial [Chloroflexi bacterium]|nr:ketopantoate reductase family protein [Chloroflexota bacterium]